LSIADRTGRHSAPQTESLPLPDLQAAAEVVPWSGAIGGKQKRALSNGCSSSNVATRGFTTDALASANR
jgi:hypothetical protein